MGKYRDILEKEDSILSHIIEKQAEFKGAVNAKDWARLMECISVLNRLSEEFSAVDNSRAEFLANNTENGEVKAEDAILLSNIRVKFIKSRAESQALREYITITRGFVQAVLDNALPRSRARIYSRNGFVKNPQPSSVVLNTLF